MAVWHVSTTGTNTSTASTADDWSDANCWPFDGTANWNALLAATSTGDTIIFNDETFTWTALLSLNSAAAKALEITSRTGATVWEPAANTGMFINNDASNSSTITISDVTIDGSSNTWTNTGTALMQHGSLANGATYNRVTWQNFTIAAVSRTVVFLVRCINTDSKKTYTFNDCTVKDFDVDMSGGAFDGLFKVDSISANPNNLEFNNLTLDNIDINCVGGACNGIIYHKENAAVTINNLIASKCITAADTGQTAGGIVRGTTNQGVLTVRNFSASQCALNGTGNTAGLFQAAGTTGNLISGGRVDALTSTGNVAGNRIGGVVGVNNSGVSATIEDLMIRNSSGFYGLGGYNSGGAAMTCKNVVVTDCSDGGQVGDSGAALNGMAFYSGGDGDTTITDCVAANISGGTNGVAIRVLHADRGGAGKTVAISGTTITNANDGTSDAVLISSDFDGQTLTVTLDQCCFDNGDNDLTMINNGATDTLNVTATNCHYTNGAASSVTNSITRGTFTNTAPTSGDPMLENTWVPSFSSPLFLYDGQNTIGRAIEATTLWLKRRRQTATR